MARCGVFPQPEARFNTDAGDRMRQWPATGRQKREVKLRLNVQAKRHSERWFLWEGANVVGLQDFLHPQRTA